MKHTHPSDTELQRYLNNALPEIERKRISRHMKVCPACQGRRQAWIALENALEDLPLLKAPAGLCDRVWNSLFPAAIAPQGEGAASFHTGADGRSSRPRRYMRPELKNGMVAVAATYFFISTGIVGKIASFDAGQWGYGVRAGAIHVFQTVESVSRHLFF